MQILCDNWKQAEKIWDSLALLKIIYAKFPNHLISNQNVHILADCYAPKFYVIRMLLEVVSVLFQIELDNKRLHGHFAAVFGFICGLLQLSLVQTQQLFLFSTLRTVIASAVRLGNIGPLQVTDVISFEFASSAWTPNCRSCVSRRNFTQFILRSICALSLASYG